MPVTSGTRFGSYEILSLLGAGGMGEVYRAHDARLGRAIAIKVLPDALASDPDRLARFKRAVGPLAPLRALASWHVYGGAVRDRVRSQERHLHGKFVADRGTREIIGSV